MQNNEQSSDKKMILSGKVHESLEDPLSALFYDISDSVSPFLYDIGITPNVITTFRMMLIIFVFTYYFNVQSYNIAAIIYIVAYFGDCLDGHMARKYNMETNIGDYYDHIVDTVSTIITLYFISMNMSKNYTWILLIIYMLLFFSIVQLGCQEKYLENTNNVNKINSNSLKLTQYLCPSDSNNNNTENIMRFAKYFGVGTYMFVVTIVIWNFKYFIDQKYIQKIE